MPLGEILGAAKSHGRHFVFAEIVFDGKPFKSASGPMMRSTLSRSTNSMALAFAVAGTPAVSATTSSILRPASVKFLSFRKQLIPSSR
jgi:hypothetical protein